MESSSLKSRARLSSIAGGFERARVAVTLSVASKPGGSELHSRRGSPETAGRWPPMISQAIIEVKEGGGFIEVGAALRGGLTPEHRGDASRADHGVAGLWAK